MGLSAWGACNLFRHLLQRLWKSTLGRPHSTLSDCLSGNNAEEAWRKNKQKINCTANIIHSHKFARHTRTRPFKWARDLCVTWRSARQQCVYIFVSFSPWQGAGAAAVVVATIATQTKAPTFWRANVRGKNWTLLTCAARLLIADVVHSSRVLVCSLMLFGLTRVKATWNYTAQAHARVFVFCPRSVRDSRHDADNKHSECMMNAKHMLHACIQLTGVPSMWDDLIGLHVVSC